MAQLPETFPPEEEIFDFLQEIRVHLAYDQANRDALFDLFEEFGKSEITDVEHVLGVVEPLLQNYPHLVAQFYGLVDPVRQGLQFLKRAQQALGPANYDEFVSQLYRVDQEQSLDAHGVYREFKQPLGKFKLPGEERDDLLRGLAGFLPTKYSPQPPRLSLKAEREEHRRRPERKPSSYAGADAPESSRPNRAKKQRLVDVNPAPAAAPACFVDTGAAGSSRPRRPRMYEYGYEYDGWLPERKLASCAVSVAGDSKSSRARRPSMYENEYEVEYDGWLPERKSASCAVAVADDSKSSRPSRAKKPRADDSMSRHAHIGGAAGGSVRVAAPAPDANAGEVKRFREAWEFETGYSLLDATLKRAEKLQDERKRLHGARASLDELFPSPESRGYLAKMYHDRWNHMRQLLEHGGDHTAFALEAIVNRLRTKDAEAVDEARRRQDPARAAQRLQELTQDRVRLERERVRHA